MIGGYSDDFQHLLEFEITTPTSENIWILGIYLAKQDVDVKTAKTKKEIDIRIKELTYINEISMTIGLFVLAVGTFLGGIWANESWGRY